MLSRNLGEVYKKWSRNMSVLYKRIEELCSEHGETITSMCKASGASRASLSDLKVGRKQSLSAETLSKIAAHFNVSVDYLLSGCYRSSCTAYPNGITVFYGGTLQDIEERMATKEPGTFRVVYQCPGAVVTVDNDSSATEEQINSVIALYSPNHDVIGKKSSPTLTEKDERDIARDLERIMAQLGTSGDLMFDGDPMSDEARESMLAAMELGLRAAKLKNKERFTPKKYRKD